MLNEKFTYYVPYNGVDYKVGYNYNGNRKTIVNKIIYKSRPFWQFWKRKEIAGYEVAILP